MCPGSCPCPGMSPSGHPAWHEGCVLLSGAAGAACLAHSANSQSSGLAFDPFRLRCADVVESLGQLARWGSCHLRLAVAWSCAGSLCPCSGVEGARECSGSLLFAGFGFIPPASPSPAAGLASASLSHLIHKMCFLPESKPPK